MSSFVTADLASWTAPVVLTILLVVVTLVVLRAACAVLGFALKRAVSRNLDIAIALSLLLFMAAVFLRFKIVG
jgi:hypothetical protein